MNVNFENDLFDEVSWTSAGSSKMWANRTGILAGLFVIGTGGSAAIDHATTDSTAATKNIMDVAASSRSESASDVFFTPAARLAIVRRWFSLNIKDLAEVMRVQRPTIYAWLASRSVPQTSNLARIRQLHELARSWRRLANQPLMKASSNTDEVKSLLSALRAPVLEEKEILARFRNLASSSEPWQTKAHRIAKEAGIDVTEHDEPEMSFDSETLFS